MPSIDIGGYAGNMLGMRQQSSDLWTKMLQEAQALQSGQMLPTQLPEFKGFEQTFNDALNKYMKNIFSQASSRGIEGGALAQLMSGGQEQGIQGLLQAMNQMWGKAYGRVPQYAQGGMNNWMDFANMLLKKQEIDERNKLIARGQNIGAIMGGVDKFSGGLSGLFSALGQSGGSAGGAMGGSPSGLGYFSPSMQSSGPDPYDWARYF